MASNNNELVFYQQWAVAGLQMDKYSTNPWCVDSKNLDIFSDTQSVKAMAWTDKETITDEWVDIDPKERFYLAADGRVWDSQEEVWYNHDYFDANSNLIDYNDWEWQVRATFWTPKKLLVAYDADDEWKTISIITDRLVYSIYSDWVRVPWKLQKWWSWVTDVTSATTVHSLRLKIASSSEDNYLTISQDDSYAHARVRFSFEAQAGTYTWVKWTTKRVYYVYNKPQDYFEPRYPESNPTATEDVWDISWTWWTSTFSWESYMDWEYYADNWLSQSNANLRVDFTCTDPDWYFFIDIEIKEQWQYLYPKDRNMMTIEDEFYMEWQDDTIYNQLFYDPIADKLGNPFYYLETGNTLDFPDWYTIVAFARSFDYQYIFVNKWDMWIVYYATDVNLAAWDKGWRFPWMQFINAIMIWQYVYVIADERWVRWLYVYYNWDMKKLVWADTRYTEWLNLIDWKEKYNFNGLMANWRNNVVCATKDSVFMRWRNRLWSNVWTFILNTDWEIVDIKTDRGYLDVYYTVWQTKYRKHIQDDVNIRRYEPEFEIVYPVQINSHILEKEPLKLAVSYDIPNSSTSMDVYLSVNDYHFWSFLTDWTVEPEVWDKFKVSWLSWDYWLIFVEKNWNWLTFTLDGNIPYQSANTTNLISEDTLTTIAYTDFNHFKKIWTISKTSPQEKIGKHTLLNISNGNDLPIVRKAQVKIVWKTDTHVSPLLYDVRLLSNQYDK